MMTSSNSNSNNYNNKRILLVDNEPDNTSVFGMALEDDGFVVDMFNDSVFALSNFKPDFYDLILLDINMPNMNGIELYREIRKIDDKVKVCFLTASEMYSEELRMQIQILDQDVKCFIPKPIRLFDLVNIVKRELNK
jgi:CheY-like chemotaxis protein